MNTEAYSLYFRPSKNY